MSRKSKGNPAAESESAASPGATAGGRGPVLAICAFLFASVWLVFGQTLRHPFVNYDDNAYVYENASVTNGVTRAGIVSAFTEVHASNWHPLTWLSHMVDCQLYGLHPAGHHFDNVLLHAVTTVLLFLLLRRLTGTVWPAAFVAAVFALHPLRAESVAWVAERKDVLSGLFFVLTIAAYVRSVQRPFSIGRYLDVAGLFALGLMSKPMLVTLPFILLLLDYWPLRRISDFEFRFSNLRSSRTLRRLIAEKVPLFLAALAVAVVTMLAQHKAIDSLQKVPVPARLGNAAVGYVAYLGQMFYPANLAIPYPLPENGPPAWQVGGSIALLAAISAGVFSLRRRRPYLLVGWLWYLGMLVPVIGLLQVGAQARADRYTYLPQIGLYLAIANCVSDWCGTNARRRMTSGFFGIAIVIALGTLAWVQTGYWRNSETLWRHSVACTSNNTIAEFNLGTALYDTGQFGEALAHWSRADRANPTAVLTYNNYGNQLLQQGHPQQARMLFERALEINSNFAPTHNHFAVLLAGNGEIDAAVAHFNRALALDPDDPDTHGNFARLLAVTGRTGDAIAHYHKAIALNPSQFLSHYYLGEALFQSGQVNEAAGSFQRAVDLKPDDPEAQGYLGIALQQGGRAAEALPHLQIAVKLRTPYPEAQIHLGLALIQQHRYRDAIACFDQLLRPGNQLTAPQFAGVCNNLAWVLATCPEQSIRNGRRAIALASQANDHFKGTNPGTLDTLAAAYAEAGEFDRAIETVQSAIERAKIGRRNDLGRQLEQHLDLYRANHPLRDDPGVP
jgi:tetratricopeptide (TPR) repeat protein